MTIIGSREIYVKMGKIPKVELEPSTAHIFLVVCC